MGDVAPIGTHALRSWLRGELALSGQHEATFYFSLPPEELRLLMLEAREVKAGRRASRGALVLRELLVNAGLADPIEPAPEVVEAFREVDDMSDQEVLEAVAAERGLEATEMVGNPRAIDQIRTELIARFAAIEAQAQAVRDKQPRSKRLTTRKEEE